MQYIIGIGIIAVIIIVYVLSYALNEKIPVPEGCEELQESVACSSCTNGGCSIKKKVG